MDSLPANFVQPVGPTKNDVMIKLIEAVKEHPYTTVAITGILGCVIVAIDFINAKYGRESEISYTPNEGFKYATRPTNTN